MLVKKALKLGISLFLTPVESLSHCYILVRSLSCVKVYNMFEFEKAQSKVSK